MPIDTDRAIIAAVGIGIILLNLGIIYALLTGSAQRQLEVFHRLVANARRPWQAEDKSLSELRDRIEHLQPEESSREKNG
ncbi:MAG: hypothetical protein ACLFWD_01605 [Anaerolineales bacterium]